MTCCTTLGVGAGVGGVRPALGLLGVASLVAVPAVLIGLCSTTKEVSP
ncbi:hypothetical protein CLV43_108346 [Umezawaea tangerina]|uniref:Uncharacterized protein n=1 Tax=Umezawaea tangerina TaxID=84725 RepID=A0A2T0SZV4_9PSEU|nr:hypothetical protein CLV43_108346 [Umezawaea tangerina]